MLNIIAVFAGGGAGAVLRYLLNTLFNTINVSNFPYSTLVANIVGCFVIGFLGVYFISKINVTNSVKLFATTGFCGGLSTFSAFSAECLAFFNQGKFLELFIYVFLSVFVCLLAVGLGAYLADKV